jgi:hypothetical protein
MAGFLALGFWRRAELFGFVGEFNSKVVFGLLVTDRKDSFAAGAVANFYLRLLCGRVSGGKPNFSGLWVSLKVRLCLVC